MVVEIAESDLMALAKMLGEVVEVRWTRSLDTRQHQVEGLVNLGMEGMCIPVSRELVDWADT